MALALCLLLDRRSDRLVRELWERLEDNGIPTLLSHTHGHHVPHLSYAVLLAWEPSAVAAVVAGFADAGSVELAAQGTVVFPRGRVALAFPAPPGLAARQLRVVEALAATGATVHRHYDVGHWVPHVSVSTGIGGDRLAEVVTAVSDRLPLTVVCDHAALIDTSDGTATRLPVVP